MRGLHRTPLFRYCQAGLWQRGVCLLFVLLLPVFAWILPLLTPWEEQPVVLQPARAQAVWFYLWAGLFTILPFQAATLGKRLRSEGVLEHLHAGGCKPWQSCLQMMSAVTFWLLLAVGVGALFCITVCAPGNPVEVGLWRVLVMQYACLFLTAAVPLVMLAGALGTRVSETVACLLPGALLVLGLFGLNWLQPLLHSELLKLIWVALPHYDLADLTHRLVFKLGPLPVGTFCACWAALLSQGAALVVASLCLFRTHS